MALLASALVTGLLGSVHCAGMCGPLALAVACGRPEAAGRRLALFAVGKTFTYVLLGLAAGTLGTAAVGWASPGRTAGVVALVAGTLMIAFGLHTLTRRARPAARPSALGALMARVLSARRPEAPLLAGSLAGLLPCGLVYAMVAQALAAGSALAGGLVMASFGLGTAPSVVAAGWLGSRLGVRHRRLGEWLAAAAVVLMGALAVWRGLRVLLGAEPPCDHG